MAPTTSSILSLSSNGTAKTTITPPTAPIRVAAPSVGRQRFGGDRDEARERAVQHHGEVDLLVDQLGEDQRRDRAAGGRGVGVGEDPARRRRRRRRCPWQSCEPPLKPNQPSHRMNVPSVASVRFEPGKALTEPSLPYLPMRGAEDDGTGERGPATDRVHDGGAGEVEEAEAGVEEAAAPLPGGLDRVDESR